MPYEPVMVIGTGRCASSFVSGILHNDLNICMGLQFEKPSKYNPDGYYEDIDIKRNNENLMASYITLQGWARNIKNIVQIRMQRNIPWGFKDPRLCDILGIYLSLFNYPKVIWCIRDRELVLKSLVGKIKYTEEQAKLQHDIRMSNATRLLQGREHLKLYFSDKKVEKDEIIYKIKGKWNELS